MRKVCPALSECPGFQQLASSIIILVSLGYVGAASADSKGNSQYPSEGGHHQVSGKKIYETDAFGRIQYHRPHLTIQGDRLIETNAYGRKLYHKPGFTLKEGKLYQTDSRGRIQYHKPSFIVTE